MSGDLRSAGFTAALTSQGCVAKPALFLARSLLPCSRAPRPAPNFQSTSTAPAPCRMQTENLALQYLVHAPYAPQQVADR